MSAALGFILALSTAPAAEAPPEFVGTQGPLPKEVVEKVTDSSWRTGCPLALDKLAYMQVSHWGFDGEVHQGVMIVDAAVAVELLEIFRELFEAQFPIEKMRLVDEYEASDDKSMTDNNTSAFNCRGMHGKKNVFSKHSYGRAIDINPRINPYVSSKEVAPTNGADYVDRTKKVPGIIVAGDVCVEAFTKRGWKWGGSWRSIKDYQHFEKKKAKKSK